MDRLDRRLVAVPRPGGDRAVHPRGGQAVHDLGPAADPLLHPPGEGLGLRLEPVAGDPARPTRAGCSRRSSRCRSPSKCSCWRAPSSRRTAVFAVARWLRARFGSVRRPVLVARATPSTRWCSSEDGEVVQPGPRARLRRQPALLRPARPGRPGALPGGRGGRAARAPGRWSGTSRRSARRRRGSSGTSDALRIVRDRRRAPRRRSRSPCRRPATRPSSGRSPSRTWRTPPRRVKVVPYLEWVLNRPDADRGHTQYNRLFAEVEYVARAARRPRLGQAREGDGPARLGRRPGRVPVVPGRFHRPRPEPLDAPGPGDAGVLRGPRTPTRTRPSTRSAACSWA